MINDMKVRRIVLEARREAVALVGGCIGGVADPFCVWRIWARVGALLMFDATSVASCLCGKLVLPYGNAIVIGANQIIITLLLPTAVALGANGSPMDAFNGLRDT